MNIVSSRAIVRDPSLAENRSEVFFNDSLIEVNKGSLTIARDDIGSLLIKIFTVPWVTYIKIGELK